MEIFAGIPWSQHLNGVGRDGNYGEEVTLCANANIFGNEIFVVSSLGQQELVHNQPVDLEPLSRVVLVHFTEGQCFERTSRFGSQIQTNGGKK